MCITVAPQRPSLSGVGLTLVCLAATAGVSATETAVQNVAETLVTGHVVDVGSGFGVPGARLTLSSRAAQPLVLEADATGAFRARSLPPGYYYIEAEAPGYSPGAFGRLEPLGERKPFRLLPGTHQAVSIAVWRLSTIEGAVRSSDGTPVVGATVRLLDRAYRLEGGPVRHVPQAASDGDGHYVFRDLIPGRYSLALVNRYASTESCGSPSPLSRDLSPCEAHPVNGSLPAGRSAAGEPLAYASAFFPNRSRLSEAAEVAVEAGSVMSGADFVADPIPTGTLRGTISGSEGPLGGVVVTLTAADSDRGDYDELLTQAVANTSEKGTFEFPAVPPGAYDFQAEFRERRGPINVPKLPAPPGGGPVVGKVNPGVSEPSELSPIREARATVVVEAGQVQILDAALQRAPSIRGRLTFPTSGSEAVAANAFSSRAMVSFVRPSTGERYEAAVDARGAFGVPSMASGTYRITAPVVAGWAWSNTGLGGPRTERNDVRVACCDAIEAELDYTEEATVLGSIIETDQALGLSVFLIPESRVPVSVAPQRYRRASVDASGSFEFRRLPEGDYVIAAVGTGGLPMLWTEPQSTSKLIAIGTRVRLKRGETRRLSVAPRGL